MLDTSDGPARLRSLQYLDDSQIRGEINIALKTTLASGFGRNDSLCHGDLGNLELLLHASQSFADPWWKAKTSRIGTIILDRTQRHGWCCGVPLGVETPGLMTGLSGIDYEFLRLAKTDQVPYWHWRLLWECDKDCQFTHPRSCSGRIGSL